MPPPRSPSDRRAGAARLSACAAGIALVWLVLLPALGRTAAVREHVERNEARGVDAAARYYTELPGLTQFLDRATGDRRRAGDALWRPAFASPNDSPSSVSTSEPER